jgi:hypothetical protein
MVGMVGTEPNKEQCKAGAAALTRGGTILSFGHDDTASQLCRFTVTAFAPWSMVPLSVTMPWPPNLECYDNRLASRLWAHGGTSSGHRGRGSVGRSRWIFARSFVSNRTSEFGTCLRQASKTTLKILTNFEAWRFGHFGDDSDTPAGAGASVWKTSFLYLDVQKVPLKRPACSRQECHSKVWR